MSAAQVIYISSDTIERVQGNQHSAEKNISSFHILQNPCFESDKT